MKDGDNTTNREKAYTLIELLVVIVIMVLVFSITTGNFRDFETRRAMDNAANQVRADLRLAQEYARSGEKPDSGCDQLEGYAFRSPGSNPNSYYLTPVCSGGADCTSGAGSCTTRSLDPEISISTNDIRFNVLGRGTTLSSTATITLTHDNGDTRQVQIESGGNVE